MNVIVETWWTPQRTEQLLALWNDGLSGAQIARAMKAVSRSAIMGKLHRMKLPKRSQDAVRETNLQRMKVERHTRQRPKLRLAGGGVVFEVAVAPPPLVVVGEAAWDALPDTAPRPWEERTTEQCSWPVGDGLSCCEPVHKFGWCASHHEAGRVPFKKGERLERNLRRHIA